MPPRRRSPAKGARAPESRPVTSVVTSMPARLAPFVLAALLCVATPPWAAEPGDVSNKRSELQDVQRRIQQLERDIVGTESSRSDAAGKRAEAERAVSAAQRRLRQLRADRTAVEQALAAGEAEQRAVEARIGARQDELAQWLRRHYMHGGSEVAPFLSARDPNQLARDLHYLEHLGRARLALIEALRTDLLERAALVQEIGERRDNLVKLEGEQRRERAQLEKVLADRARLVAQLDERLKSQRGQVAALRQDEEALAQLIAALNRRLAEREAQRRAAEAAASAAARAASEPRAAPAPAPRTSGRPGGRSEPVVGQVRQIAGPTPTGVKFSDLQGKMKFPVRGELVGRFGAPRAEGGTRWRGVFIRARDGEEVLAVAAGEVVFSDWLRGYGNLIIIDHGDDYMTIYGHNDALFSVVGDRIVGGHPIAAVGASGGVAESGLYFEIRHRGQPLDPMKWVRLN